MAEPKPDSGWLSIQVERTSYAAASWVLLAADAEYPTLRIYQMEQKKV